MGKRISQLNALSSASLNTTLVGIDNGVTYKITLDVLEDAVINMLSASTDARLDFLETFSSSFNTFSASLDNRLDNVTIDTSSLATKTLLNTFTQSYYSDSASFDNRITSHISGTSYISESYNEFVTSYHAESSSFSSRIEAATNEQFIAGLLLTSSYQIDSSSFIERINQHISGTNYISESLTEFITSYHSESSSFSSRIEAATNEQFIAGLLLTSSYSIDSASFNNRIISGSAVAGTISSSAQITALGFISTSTDLTSLNTFTQSIDSRVDSLEAATSSYITSLDGVVSSSAQILSGSGIVSGATQITAMGYAKLVGGNTFYSEQTFTNKVTFQNTLSASVIDNLNVYSASYLTFTQSYYSDSSSFSSRILNITASANINTGSFVTTSSFNAFTASAQMVTTGSNSFNGTQIITGSLIITTGSFIGTQITANTASLYLTSGSNMYVQNNGLVEITGSLNVSATTTLKGAVIIGTGSGTEGGEISLAYAQGGSTSLTGSTVAFDIYGDKLRIFEGGGTNRGGYFDISTLAAGVGTDLGKLTYFIEAYANVSYTLPGSYTNDVCRYSVVSTNVNVPTAWFNTSTYTFTPLKAGYWEIIASYDVYRNGEASLIIQKNGTSVAQAGAISAVVQQITKIIYMNGSTDYINIYNTGFNSNARTQIAANAFFQARFVGA